MKQVGFFIWSVVILYGPLILTPHITQAAALYLDPAGGLLHRGDAVTVAVRLDVDELTGECVNAVDGVLNYTSNIDAVDVSIGNSIFPLWIEFPVINQELKTITFAGGIPNGYCGRLPGDPRLSNIIAEIIFRSPGFTIGGSSELLASVQFSEESSVYLNDGQGTRVAPATYGATFELDTRAGSKISDSWQEAIRADNVPPSEFSIFLHQDETAFSQKYYIVFNSSDKQTGIDRYLVMEEPLSQLGMFEWGRADAPWIEARSPYVLRDQSLNSIIRVKAIDKAGNEYVATLIPDESMRTYSDNQMFTYVISATFGIIFLLLLVTIGVFIRRRRSKNNLNSSVNEEAGNIRINDETNYE